MNSSVFRKYISLFLTILFCLQICSCENNSTLSPQNNISKNKTTKLNNSTSSSEEKSQDPVTSKWDNSTVVLEPTADGTKNFSCNVATIDISNLSEGYFMVNYSGKNNKVKLQITGPDSVTYTYDLHGGYEVFPLTAGSGNYNIGVYENIAGTQYSTAFSKKFKANITNEFGPYLYPNQYVNFNKKSLPIAKAKELASGVTSDIKVVENIYNYIIEHFTYDYDKAANVQSGYLPNVDTIYTSNTGICFDYAAVMATMLRSQKIPTRLEVGYIEEAYHAWISTYIQDVGWINGIIQFDGRSWNLMDPTFASTSSSPENFISENDKYQTKFVY